MYCGGSNNLRDCYCISKPGLIKPKVHGWIPPELKHVSVCFFFLFVCMFGLVFWIWVNRLLKLRGLNSLTLTSFNLHPLIFFPPLSIPLNTLTHSPSQQCVSHCHCLLCSRSSQIASAICSPEWAQVGGRGLWWADGKQRPFVRELVNLQRPSIGSCFASTPTFVCLCSYGSHSAHSTVSQRLHKWENTNCQQISIYFPHSAHVSEEIYTRIIDCGLWVSEHRSGTELWRIYWLKL